MRGVIQVRCQRPARRPAQALMTPSKSRSKVTRVAVLAHLPAQVLDDVEFVEEQHRALRRRPPFQRAGMRQRIKAAAIGLDQLRQRQVVHDAGEARRRGERALRIGQGVVGRKRLARDHAQQAGHTGDALRAQSPRRAPAPSARRARAALSRNSASRRSPPCGAKERRSA